MVDARAPALGRRRSRRRPRSPRVRKPMLRSADGEKDVGGRKALLRDRRGRSPRSASTSSIALTVAPARVAGEEAAVEVDVAEAVPDAEGREVHEHAVGVGVGPEVVEADLAGAVLADVGVDPEAGVALQVDGLRVVEDDPGRPDQAGPPDQEVERGAVGGWRQVGEGLRRLHPLRGQPPARSAARPSTRRPRRRRSPAAQPRARLRSAARVPRAWCRRPGRQRRHQDFGEGPLGVLRPLAAGEARGAPRRPRASRPACTAAKKAWISSGVMRAPPIRHRRIAGRVAQLAPVGVPVTVAIGRGGRYQG